MGSSNVEQAQANLNSAKQALEAAKTNLATQKRLGNPTSNYKYQVEQAKKNVERCKEALARAKKNK